MPRFGTAVLRTRHSRGAGRGQGHLFQPPPVEAVEHARRHDGAPGAEQLS